MARTYRIHSVADGGWSWIEDLETWSRTDWTIYGSVAEASEALRAIPKSLLQSQAEIMPNPGKELKG